MGAVLSADQKQHFVDHGYLLVPRAVEEEPRVSALRAIYATLGDREGMNPDWMDAYKRLSFVPELRQDPVLSRLVNEGPVAGILEDLLKPDGALIYREPEVKVLFPVCGSDTDATCRLPRLDGIISPSKPFPKGRVDNFTGSALLVLDGGATARTTVLVWPGSHRRYQSHLGMVGAESLLAGPPELDLGDPAQLELGTGDVLVLHYMTARFVREQTDIDLGVYVKFDFDVQGHDSVWWKNGFHWDDLTDIWHDWHGIASVNRSGIGG